MKSGLICKCHLLALSLVISSCVLAEPDANTLNIPFIKMETPYSKVREIMLKNRWNPHHSVNALPCTPEDQRCTARPEMQACSDVGLGQCSWLWKKKGKIVLIKTQDDDLFYGATRYYGQ
ncbi:hypothetical protein PWP93_33635 [Paraburkholderia sp. A1RI-2L]|uniref:hypothetical protein n=1 Tax=Paraburkholderia sp. A1RI-2L TaxID=3028367 RepID=UPI003B7FBCFB